jgi:hypothetical protein
MEWTQDDVDRVVTDASIQDWDAAVAALDASFPVNAQKSPGAFGGRTLLHCAAVGGHMPLLSRLLAAGADVNIREGDGCTALHLAGMYGRARAVVALVQAGADVNVASKAGCTPIFYAVDHPQCMAYLLGLPQVDLAAVDLESNTVEEVCMQWSRFEAARVIRAEVGDRCVGDGGEAGQIWCLCVGVLPLFPPHGPARTSRPRPCREVINHGEGGGGGRVVPCLPMQCRSMRCGEGTSASPAPVRPARPTTVLLASHAVAAALGLCLLPSRWQPVGDGAPCEWAGCRQSCARSRTREGEGMSAWHLWPVAGRLEPASLGMLAV